MKREYYYMEDSKNYYVSFGNDHIITVDKRSLKISDFRYNFQTTYLFDENKRIYSDYLSQDIIERGLKKEFTINSDMFTDDELLEEFIAEVWESLSTDEKRKLIDIHLTQNEEWNNEHTAVKSRIAK